MSSLVGSFNYISVRIYQMDVFGLEVDFVKIPAGIKGDEGYVDHLGELVELTEHLDHEVDGL